MSNRTVVNEDYRGLVVPLETPALVHERDGKRFASYGSAVPIHTCTKEQAEDLSAVTHHYCDIFTEETLAPLQELAYVRLDDHHAEQVVVDRSKRILVTSSDGRLAQWRCAPTFLSTNEYLAGTPVFGADVSADGRPRLVSLLTARRGDRYALSNIDGIGGYFESREPWSVVTPPPGHLVYGDQSFASRDELRAHVDGLPGAAGAEHARPVLLLAAAARLSLVAASGRQVAHVVLQDVATDNIQYL